MLAAVLEAELAADDKVLDRARDEHLGRAGEAHDPRGKVDCEPGDVVAGALDLACVQPRADFESQPLGVFDDSLRAADSLCRDP